MPIPKTDPHHHAFAMVEELQCEEEGCKRHADWICIRCWHATCGNCRNEKEGKSNARLSDAF